MKVLYGITKSNFGGAQRYVFELAVEAHKLGHDVAVMCGGDGPLVQKLKTENIRVISIPELGRDISILKDWKTFRFILETLKAEQPDVFHTNSSKMGGLGNLAGRVARIKQIVFTGHGWAFNESRPIWQKAFIKDFIWTTILFAHKTICVSEKTRVDVAKWPFIQHKLFVVHNGLKPFELKSRENNKFTVGALSELHRIKGLDVLLRAWKVFIQNHTAQLVIMGAGEERKNLENLAQELNIGDSAVFKGFVNNARTQLLNFDIFVLPSRSEALPYALLEAGFAGLPVVASSVGGIPEIVENEKSGLLVEKENIEQLASALSRLFENSSFRENLGKNLKHTVETKFSFEQMAQKTFALYGSK